MIKIAGSLMILLTSVCLGFLKGQQYEDRISDIKVLEHIFRELLSDIEFGKITVAESFARIEKTVPEPFGRFLKNVCGEVKWKRGRSLESIFVGEVEQCLEKSALETADLRRLKELGRYMGAAERQSQIHSIQNYLRELNITREQLERKAPDRKKICRVFGFCGGIFLLILLL